MNDPKRRRRPSAIVPRSFLGTAIATVVPACALAFAAACSEDTDASAPADAMTDHAFRADVSYPFDAPNDRVFYADVSAHFDVQSPPADANADADADAGAGDAEDAADADGEVG